MSWTQSDLDSLEKQINSVQRVRFAEREVGYRTLDELLRLKAVMQDSIAKAAGTATPRASYVRFSKG